LKIQENVSLKITEKDKFENTGKLWFDLSCFLFAGHMFPESTKI
jgi:hypothetical protein